MKYWEADIKGTIFTATTLKELATKLNIKPSLIEGVYYRSRLQDKIKIRKVVEPKADEKKMNITPGDFFVSFE